MQKECINCKELKELNTKNFGRSKGAPNGFLSMCKPCFNKRQKTYREKNIHKRNKTSRRDMNLKEAQELFKNNGAELLSTSFTNQKATYHYICSCGEPHYKSIVAFKEVPGCPKCTHGARHTTKEVVEHLTQLGMRFLDAEYKGIEYKHNVLCVCGRHTKRTYHSIQRGSLCWDCAIDGRTGEKNPRWKPELTDEDRANRRYAGSFRWRRLVIQKDSGRCLKCGDSDEILNAHHVIPHSVSRELRTEISNGATLCVVCHRDFHRKYKLEDVDEDALEEFLGGRKW